jgi:hypothetical protein
MVALRRQRKPAAHHYGCRRYPRSVPASAAQLPVLGAPSITETVCFLPGAGSAASQIEVRLGDPGSDQKRSLLFQEQFGRRSLLPW